MTTGVNTGVNAAYQCKNRTTQAGVRVEAVHPHPRPHPDAGLLEGSSSPLVLTAEEVTSEEAKVDVAVARAIKPQVRRGDLLQVLGDCC